MKTLVRKSVSYAGIAVVCLAALSMRADAAPGAAARPVSAAALPASTVTAPPAPGDTTIQDYKIQPGDILSIAVPNFTVPNLNAQVTVPPDGKISLALIGVVTAAGKSTAELQNELAKKWNEYVVDPAVSVTLMQKHVDNVTVYGFVLHPGAITYQAPLRLTQAIGAAGGALTNGDMHKVILTHPDGGKQIIDLSQPDISTGSPDDLLLNVGDTVYVPERRTEVTVVGEVKNPGSYDYKDGMTVMDALTAVGGILNDTADLKGSTLTHDGKDQPLDLYTMLRQGDMSGNIKLSAGDRIMIPEARNRIYVFGDVRQPGYYLYKQNDRMLDALNGVGGPNSDADLDKVNLIRIDPTKNAANFERVDLGKFLKKGDLASNRELQPGDCLYIPKKTSGFKPEDAWVILQGMNLLNVGAQIFSKGPGN